MDHRGKDGHRDVALLAVMLTFAVSPGDSVATLNEVFIKTVIISC